MPDEIIDFREQFKNIAGMEFNFESLMAAIVRLNMKNHAGGGTAPPPAI
jgi:hypothetical protein